MIILPEKYKKIERIYTKTFITKDLSVADKKRLREALVSAAITYQIMGEGIPSVVNEERNCTVIMFLDIKLKNIKDAAFAAEIIQSLIKALCVIRFYDATNEVYSFAMKRLNKQSKSEIVVEDTVLSCTQPHGFSCETSELLDGYIAYDKIKNRADKLAFYKEMMVKAFIISNLILYSGMRELLDKSVWYRSVDLLFTRLRELQGLKEELRLCDLPSDKVRVNGEIKKLIEGLRI